MLRRDFLRRSAKGLGAAWLASNSPGSILGLEPLPQKVTAHDEVVLGKTGIRTSRLAMGTGTVGFGGASNQTRLGSNPFRMDSVFSTPLTRTGPTQTSVML
jgi:hypothetical protein